MRVPSRGRLRNSSRDHLATWVSAAAASVPEGSLVLDAGSGDAPYRDLFSAMMYESADFMQVDKVYEPPTYVCDLRDIPVENARFDLVICNQVMEHIPAPVDLLRELSRVTKPGGAIWMSAPLFFEEHEQPHDYYRYTQFAWRHLAEEAGLDVVSLEWMEGYLGTLAYQLSMAARRDTVRAISAGPGWAPGQKVAAMAFGGACFVLAKWATRQDRRWKLTSTGMPKNYCAVLRVP